MQTATSRQGRGQGVADIGDDAGPVLTAEYPDPRRRPWPGFALAADAAVRHLHEQLGLDLWLVTHLEGDDLVVVASAGPWDELMPPGTRVPFRAAFCSRMVDRTGPVCAPDVLDVPAYAPLVEGVLSRVRAYVGSPLDGDDGQFFGTLSAVSGTRQRPSLTDAVPTVEVVGQMLSTIVAREQVAQARSADAAAAYALAQRDQLTGLSNRRGWVTALEHEESRCRRYGSAAGVIVLDLDELKQVNDTSGHAAGDELIALCGEVLRVTSRPGDTVARTGGDEFAVLAVECDAQDLRALQARLRMQLRAAGVSAATGGATRRPGEHLAGTWERADVVMYQDKRLRRRRRALGTDRPEA
jgi:diguanylate cyclase (GGDEF)-like protein